MQKINFYLILNSFVIVCGVMLSILSVSTMTATEKSYQQNFLKVLCIIIRAKLSQESMKNLQLSKKKFQVYDAFDCRRYQLSR